MESNKLTVEVTSSVQYPIKELEAKDYVIEKDTGETVPVTVLPTSEMPDKTIFGYKDPLEGSPAREMTRNMLKGDLLGSFIERIDDEFLLKVDGGAGDLLEEVKKKGN